jgi:hypothetical protein
MAQFPRVNGDYLPVLNNSSGSYVNSGANAVQSNASVQPAGPFLAFYTVTAAGPLTGTQVGVALQATAQLATIHIYEYYNAANDSLAMAIYPINAWTTTSLQANIRAALTAASVANAVTVTAQALFTGDTYPPVAALVPNAPTIGTATALSATTANVTFTPEYDGGSAITSFTATSTPGSLTATGASSPLTVTGLTTGTAYTFAVTATNSVGTGVASTASNSVTTWAVPGAPTVGTATQTGQTTATLAFTAGTTGGTPITSYTVTSTPPGGVAAAGTTSPLSITGLTAATSYTFVVKAVNAVGAGANSAASNSITTAS